MSEEQPNNPFEVTFSPPLPFTQHELIVKDESGNVVDNANVSTFTKADGTVVEDLINPTGQRSSDEETPTLSAEVPCPAVLLPTADDFSQAIIAIGNRYGWEELKALEEVLGVFPLSHTWDKINFDVPELEWEGRIEAMIEEFKMFPAIKIAEVLGSLVDLDLLKITDPIFGVEVDLAKLVSDPEYKPKLVAEFQEKFEELKDMMPSINRENFDGTDGLDSPALLISQAFKDMILEVKKMLTESIYYAFEKALIVFKEIWDLLNLDFIPTLVIDLLTFDVEGFIQGLKDKWKELKKDLNFTQSFKDYLLGIELPLIGFTVGDLINMELGDKQIDMPEWDTQKIISKIGAYFRDLPQKIIEDWMKYASEFLEKIGLKLSIPIPFTFCAFLEVIGVPKEINLKNALLVDA